MAEFVIRVDKSACAGHALCNARAPDLFTLDELGYSTADGRRVSAEDEDRARRGARSCPERAITIEEA